MGWEYGYSTIPFIYAFLCEYNIGLGVTHHLAVLYLASFRPIVFVLDDKDELK